MGLNRTDIFQLIELNDCISLEQTLISSPYLANEDNEQGLTPLGISAHVGHLNAVQILFNHHANINAVSHSNIAYIPSNTALHAAIAGARNFEVIEFLLKNGAKTNIVDSNGHTALHTAAFHDDNTDLIQLLLQYGASVHTKTADGKTALEIAVEQGHNRVAEQLRDYVARS